jgi:hypothetical protein
MDTDKAYAVVGPDDRAINFILWDGVTEFDYGQGAGNYVVPLDGVGKYGFGWLWDGAGFIDPSAADERGPTDFPLTARQLRLGIIQAGMSLTSVQATIEAIPDQVQRETAQVWWEYTDPVLWDHPVRRQLTELMGLSEEQAAAMWMQAKDIAA